MPVSKYDNKFLVNNYRPISILPVHIQSIKNKHIQARLISFVNIEAHTSCLQLIRFSSESVYIYGEPLLFILNISDIVNMSIAAEF